MLKLTTLFLLMTSYSLQAKTIELMCEAKINTTKVFQKSVTLQENEKNHVFGEFEEFTFYISSKGNDVLELQTLNHIEPSRTYATGKVNSQHSYIDLAIWKREFLLEVRCTL